ncbi:hypothetical protein DAPPUDRAFT_240260 [Daphnia pulex]|uniref:Uncharacterized protein n=1 Tax=Daphnia pulex TaxID=6669 RepID=E9GB96_DAPPU|nr:hypothetical protein DAPPUDRAFT_240260 [Daphnia pulex]|eukprot:EFX83397.1 hypothetical protein DAPPUDRAFT_240260 [Daphnia pulex]
MATFPLFSRRSQWRRRHQRRLHSLAFEKRENLLLLLRLHRYTLKGYKDDGNRFRRMIRPETRTSSLPPLSTQQQPLR